VVGRADWRHHSRRPAADHRRAILLFIFHTETESVEKLFSERNFQISSEKNEEGEGILGLKSAAD
jgi:hypothetical protein